MDYTKPQLFISPFYMYEYRSIRNRCTIASDQTIIRKKTLDAAEVVTSIRLQQETC